MALASTGRVARIDRTSNGHERIGEDPITSPLEKNRNGELHALIAAGDVLCGYADIVSHDQPTAALTNRKEGCYAIFRSPAGDWLHPE